MQKVSVGEELSVNGAAGRPLRERRQSPRVPRRAHLDVAPPRGGRLQQLGRRPGLTVSVPGGGNTVPVVLQITQRSGMTLSMGANLLANSGTAECPAKDRVAIPLQIYGE